MGLFDSLQDIVGGISENVQGPLQDVVTSITDNQAVQDIQEHATTLSDTAGETLTSGTETVQNTIDDVMNNLGL